MARVLDPDELEARARTLLPADVYDYYAGGSGREAALRDGPEAWRRVTLRPRVLRDVRRVDTSVTLAGARLPTPVCVAPMGFHHLASPDGELASARGAAAAGALYVLSSRSTRRIEDVAAVLAGQDGRWWFQVYVLRDRSLTEDLVRRAAAAGAEGLVLTADAPVLGRRRRNRGEDLIANADFLINLGHLDDVAAAEQAPDVGLDDIGWLREISGGLPVLVKGVLRGDDAAACAAAGAAGIVVSNHGGRQLDAAVPTASALPEVAAALAAYPGCEVLVDGGLRSGLDVLRALALGARAALVGRPVLWALACGGADGVRDLLAGLTGSLAHEMALAGAAAVADAAGLR
jgi:4-hydroxymandelate oxidase